MWFTVVVSTFVLMTASGGESNNSTVDPALDIQELVGGLSDQNQASLVNSEYDAYVKNFTAHHPPTRPYEQFQPSSLLRGRDWEWRHIADRIWTQDHGQALHFQHYVNQNPGHPQVPKACFILSSIYQRARLDINKHYKFRDFYVNTLEYEVGYLCHVIIAKYMNMLELYEIMSYRYIHQSPEGKMKMPPRYAFFLYVNMVEYSKTIIYYCNMLHEIEYKYEETGEETHWNDFANETDISTAVLTITREKHQKQFEKYLKVKKHQQAMKYKETYKKQKGMHVAGLKDTTTSRATRPVRYWAPKKYGRDYGWSIEHW